MKRYTLRRFDKLTGLNFKAAPWTDRFLDIPRRFFPVEFASTSICPKEAKSYDNALGTGPAEQFLKCGAGNHLFWSGAGEGGGANLAFLSLCLFRTVGLLNLSWVIVELSHLYKFPAAEKYLSPVEPDCTCRIHQYKFADYDITLWVPVTPSCCLVCHRNAPGTTSSADIIRFKKP